MSLHFGFGAGQGQVSGLPAFKPTAIITSLLQVLLCALASNALDAQADFSEYRYTHTFPIEACVEDMNFYKARLEKEHPNLYLYTSQAEFNRIFDSLTSAITYPMNSINFYNTLTAILPVIKDGHTHIFPDPSTTADNDAQAPFLPLKVHWESNRLYVIKDYSGTGIAPGTEITVINDVTVERLYDIMIRRQIRDGYNETYPRWILEKWFAEYYSYHFGNPRNFLLYTINPDGSQGSYSLRGLTKDSIEYYRSHLFNERTGAALYGRGIRVSLDTAMQTAVLTIKDFHNDILESKYHQNFRKDFLACFRQIQGQAVDHLILDLRDNQGGDVENGILLLSHLLDTTFQYIQSYEEVDPSGYKFPMARLEPFKGPSTGWQSCAENHFKGKLYVLINGGSFSNTGIVCAVLQDHHRCTFIGTETGGNPAVFSGGGKYFQLPNTRTQVLIPSLRYNIRGVAMNTGAGLSPDVKVEPSTADLIQGKDPVLEAAYQMIRADLEPKRP